MATLLSKKAALLLFCYFRQAERSIHHAVSCPTEWSQFVAYYDAKQTEIITVITMLKDAGAARDSDVSREDLTENSLLSVGRSIAGLLWNRLKRTWSFSVRELSFFSGTLDKLLRMLHDSERPNKHELIELRLDCYYCHYTIGRKLIGIPEIRKADSIEHFMQSGYVNHVTFREMDI
jgi:hypothetical protein